MKKYYKYRECVYNWSLYWTANYFNKRAHSKDDIYAAIEYRLECIYLL